MKLRKMLIERYCEQAKVVASKLQLRAQIDRKRERLMECSKSIASLMTISRSGMNQVEI